MTEETNQKIFNNLDQFERDISIYKIIGQDKTVNLLTTLIEQIFYDRQDHRVGRFPAILLIGKKEIGKKLLAKAFANSLCVDSFEDIQGNSMHSGGDTFSLHENVKEPTVYYISKVDCLATYPISVFTQFLNRGFISHYNPIQNISKITRVGNKLFIFSAEEIKFINSELLNSIDHYCILQDYSQDEIKKIIQQRIYYSGIEIRSKKIISEIVDFGKGDISRSLKLLKLCYSCMRSDGRYNMTLRDLNKALEISCIQEIAEKMNLMKDGKVNLM